MSTFSKVRTWFFRLILHFEAATLFLCRRTLRRSSSSTVICKSKDDLGFSTHFKANLKHFETDLKHFIKFISDWSKL